MTAVLKRVEGGYTLHIPDELAAQAGFDERAQLRLDAQGGQLLIHRAERPVYRLEDLVAGITDENKHELIDFGLPVGNEEW